MQETDLQAVVRTYLQAFEERDLSKCVDFYADDATIHFHVGIFRGRQAIEEWHEERFAADLRVVRVNGITVQDDTAILEAVVTSNRLRAWKINRLAGKATFLFGQGKVQEVRFTARMYNPLEGW